MTAYRKFVEQINTPGYEYRGSPEEEAEKNKIVATKLLVMVVDVLKPFRRGEIKKKAEALSMANLTHKELSYDNLNECIEVLRMINEGRKNPLSRS